MLAPYRSALAAPGAPTFVAAGFLARLPISTVTLGIVLLVAGRTGSYGLAGTVSAAYVVASAASSPAMARLIDRWGQRLLLMPSMLGFGTSLSLLVLAVEGDWPSPVLHGLAAVGGLFNPPIGACIRARWTLVLESGPRLQTAFALEAVIDESIFILGPVLVTLLSTLVHETAGIAGVLVIAVAGGLWLASLRRTEPPTRGTAAGQQRQALGVRWLLPMVVASACLGVLFGSCEVVTVAFAEERGEPAAVGVLLALWAAGSLIAGLVTGAVHWKTPALTRYRAGALTLAASMLPLPFLDSLTALGIVLFLGGFTISPTLVAIVSLVEANVASSRLTEGITWVVTGVGFGLAPGAALSGFLIDRFDPSTAFWVPAAGGALATLIALSTGTSSRQVVGPDLTT